VAPGAFDEQKTTHIVTIRYHAQVTFNTRITHKGRHLYVRGIQNPDERNIDLVLLCEEVKTP
jgi:SPP1 family predicted phage head-tail adaptor